LPDDAATARAGAALGLALVPGDAVLLSGDLGAGKSALARAAVQALLALDGRVEDVPSPSFTLVQTYDTARGEVWHADLHRLGGPDGVEELGLEAAFDEAICFVEWPDRLGPLAPPRRLEVSLAPAPGLGPEGEEGRRLRASPRGAGWEPALHALAQALRCEENGA
ncbi:MAG: tRNA (adenosine(37)-N6)-threonylcarbamoyltransferase complex ATPase subunit type 1 TsaE, partial [Pseudomonadota bacterium]